MDAKSAARERFQSARDDLIALSHRIHVRLELGFEEEQAFARLCEALEDGALAMAWTCIDLAAKPDVREALMAGA
jgi:metal-dependent amidase/aminoacylase/carboxypeptidase family protein